MMTRCTTTMRPRPAAWLAASLLLSSSLNQASADSCPADLDRSGVVTGIDLALLLGQWGTCPPSLPGPPDGPGGGSSAANSTSPCPADLNGSGLVNGFDLGILLGAWGDCPPPASPPKIIYTHVAHEGDTPPGIPLPGAFYDLLNTPQIDAAGNVLFDSFLGGPGLSEVGNLAIFYGPPGGIQKLIWETEPAPDLPPGIIIKNLIGANERVCETGQITFGAELAGPGVIPIDESGPYPGAPGGGNDWGLFIANPSRGQPPRLLLRSGDPAPGLPGLTIGPDDGHNYFALEQSDNGTLLLCGMLSGSGVDETNDFALWTGPPDNLQLVVREGMSAQGTAPGVTFKWFSVGWSINDAGQIGLLAGLTGPGITDETDSSRWLAAPGDLQLVAWTGVPVPAAGSGLSMGLVYTTITCTNSGGDMNSLIHLVGPGITPDNEQACVITAAQELHVVAREGDQVPGAPEGVEFDFIGNAYMNELGNVMHVALLRGPGVTSANHKAKFFGPTYEQSSLSLRSGDPAPGMPPGVLMTNPAIGQIIMNDVGHIVTVIEVGGSGITPQTDTIALWRDPLSRQWQPFLQGGMTLAAHTVSLPEPSEFVCWDKTGGSDGYGLSLNDSGQFAVLIPFTDGTDGIFIVQQAPARK